MLRSLSISSYQIKSTGWVKYTRIFIKTLHIIVAYYSLPLFNVKRCGRIMQYILKAQRKRPNHSPRPKELLPVMPSSRHALSYHTNIVVIGTQTCASALCLHVPVANQRTNGPVNAHLIVWPRISTKYI